MMMHTTTTTSLLQTSEPITLSRSNRWARLVVACILIALAQLSATSGSAQIISHGDLFGPGAPPPMIGLELGIGSHSQQGTYLADCGCTFQNGTGTGFLGSIIFELPLDYEWALGMKVGMDFKNTTSTTPVTDVAVIQDPGHQSDTIAQLPFNRIGYVKTSYLTLAPFAQYQFFRMGPFVQVGPSVGILIGNHFTHTRQLTSSTLTLPDSTGKGKTLTQVRFTNGTLEETVQDGPVTDIAGIRIGALVTAGYNISLSERSIISPMLTYDLPLTVLRSTAASGWKIGSLDATIVLKFKLD